PKEGEDISSLTDSEQRANLLAGILNGTGTIEFLQKFIVPFINFKSDKTESLKFSHVSLQNNIAAMFSSAKEVSWQLPDLMDLLKNSRLLKLKRGNPSEIFDTLEKIDFADLQKLLTADPELIYDSLAEKNLLEKFIPVISPNKVKFGFLKGIERLQ